MFLNILLKVRIDRSQLQYLISTEEDRNSPWRQVSSGTHMVHQQKHMPSGKNKLVKINKHHLIRQSKLDNVLDDCFDNKLSLVALHQNHAIVFIGMF